VQGFKKKIRNLANFEEELVEKKMRKASSKMRSWGLI